MSAVGFAWSRLAATLAVSVKMAAMVAAVPFVLTVHAAPVAAQEPSTASACELAAVGSLGDLHPTPLSIMLPGAGSDSDASRAGREYRASCDLALDMAFGIADRLASFQDRVMLALDTLPPPLLDDFLDHLGRDPDAAAWRPDPADLAVLERIARENPGQFGGFARLRRDWAEGIMTGAVPSAADAQAFGLRARGCAPIPGSAAREIYAYVPSDKFRSGLTPAGVALAVAAASGTAGRSRVQSQAGVVPGTANGRTFSVATSGPGAATFDLPECLDDAARFGTGLPIATLGHSFRWRPFVATEAREVPCASGASMTPALESRRVLRGIALLDGAGVSAHPEIGRNRMRARDAGWRVERPGCDSMLAPVRQRQRDGRGWAATARTVQDCELVAPAFPQGTRVSDVARLEWESGGADGFDVAWTREDSCHRVESVARERSLPCAGGAHGYRVEARGGQQAVYANGSSRISWGPWLVVSDNCRLDGRSGDAGRGADPDSRGSGDAAETRLANAGPNTIGRRAARTLSQVYADAGRIAVVTARLPAVGHDRVVARPEGWRS